MIHYAHAASDQVNIAINTGMWHAVSSASPVVKMTLLLLVVMSLISWAIIVIKLKEIKATALANQPFLDRFWKAKSLDEIFEALDDHDGSTMANVFKAGYLELRKIADSDLATTSLESDDQRITLSGIDNLERTLKNASHNEIVKFESRLSFLATTGSTGPFIGLFGTVWGIMGAFQKIGATGMASLAVVAPGISEALIATAIGLLAAIPATVAYNHFITQIRKSELALENFSSDFLNIVKRNFFRDR